MKNPPQRIYLDKDFHEYTYPNVHDEKEAEFQIEYILATPAIKAVVDERQRQISVEGHDEKHDDEHKGGTKMKNDPINPEHYKSYSVETIDMMVKIYGPEWVAIHCELTAFKYRLRAGKKDNLQQDLYKEKWYLDKAKELREDLPTVNVPFIQREQDTQFMPPFEITCSEKDYNMAGHVPVEREEETK